MDSAAGEPAAKRKRVTKACDNCSKKRKRFASKCDGQQPCSICVAAGRSQDCSYTKVQRKRGPPAGYNRAAQESAERLKLLSVLLNHVTQKSPRVLDTLLEGIQELGSITNITMNDPRLQAFADNPLNQWLDQHMSEREAASESPANPTPAAGDHHNEQEQLLSTGYNSTFQPTASTSMQIDHDFPPFPDSVSFSSWPALPLQGHNDSSSSASFLSTNKAADAGQAQKSTPLHFGPTSNLAWLHQSTYPYFHATSSRRRIAPRPASLPPEDVINGLLDTYFQSWHAAMPIVDKQLLLTWLMEHSSFHQAAAATHSPGKLDIASGSTPAKTDWAGQQQQQPSLQGAGPSSTASTTVPSELLNAVFACALPYAPFDAAQLQQHRLSVDGFVTQAELALGAGDSASHPSLPIVQARVLLAFAALGLGHFARASHHFAVACGAAVDLGLHQQSSELYTKPEEAAYACRTWWAIFILDVLLALRLGRTTLIQQEMVDVPLPSTQGSEEVELWRPSTDLAHIRDRMHLSGPSGPTQSRVVRAHALSGFCELIKLCGIGALVATRLNKSRGPSNPSEAALSMADILSRLQMWELSLSPQLKPSRSAADSNASVMELMLLHKALSLLCLRPTHKDAPLSEQCMSAMHQAAEDVNNFSKSCAVLRSRAGFDYFLLTIAATVTGDTSITSSQQWAGCSTVLKQQSVLYPAAQRSLACLQGMVKTEPAPPALIPSPAAKSTVASGHNDSMRQGPSSQLQEPQSGSAMPWTPSDLQFDNMQGWNNGGQPLAETDFLQGDGALDFMMANSNQDVLSLLGLKGPTRPASPAAGSSSSSQLEQTVDRDLLSRFQHQGDWSEERDMSNISFLL